MVKFGKTWADLEATPREVSWRGIRSLRANPPGHAGGNRHATFATALEQAEQLFTAAAATGPAARPLPLFYGLSQAGRAVTAARLKSDPWKLLGHGIGEASGQQANTTVADFRIEPRPGKAGAFPLIAQALGSSSLPGPTRLGDLWPLIPDTHRFAVPNSGPHQLVNVQISGYRPENTPINGELSGLPAHLGVKRAEGEDLSTPRADWADEEDRVRAYLDQYPSLAGYHFGTGGGQPIGFRPNDDGISGQVPVHWTDDPNNSPTPDQLLKQVAVEYCGHINAYPCLDGTNAAIHPLVVWWSTLFGLSILARYDPERWGRAIEINTSAEAVAIEHILDTALDALPELILKSLIEDV